MEQAELKERTLARAEGTWVNYDVMGISAGLLSLEGLVDRLGSDTIRQGINIVDGGAEFDSQQRQKIDDLEMEEVTIGRRIAQEKYTARVQALAMKVAGQNALQAARLYEIRVQAHIMTAREYAAFVEREQIWLQKKRALMDVQKEEARLLEIQSRIMLEYLERAKTDVDIARAKLDVAKENVKVVTAQVDVKKAELEVIKTDLEIAMSEADEAALIAEIAHIYADVVVRELAKVKFEVDQAEIEVGFEFIAKKLEDLLMLWNYRVDTEKLRAYFEELLKHEIYRIEEQQKHLEDLKKQEAKNQTEVFFYAKDKLDGSNVIPEMRAGGRSLEDRYELSTQLDGLLYRGEGQTITECELESRDALFDKKEVLARTKHKGEETMRNVGAWAELLINAAQRAILKLTRINEYEARTFSQKIHKGFFTSTMPTHTPPALDYVPPPRELPAGDVNMPECEKQLYDDPGE